MSKRVQALLEPYFALHHQWFAGERQALLAAIGEAWPQRVPAETAMPAGTAGNDDTGHPGSYR